MAGDIGIDEQVFIASGNAASMDELVATIADGSGRVTHQYGNRVLVASLPLDDAQAIPEQVPEITVATDIPAIDEDITRGLDGAEALGLEAFALRQSDQYRQAKSYRPLADATWETAEASPPDYPGPEATDVSAEDAGSVEPRAATSTRLTGRVAVGLVIVTGVGAGLEVTATERVKIVAEVQNGLGWLGSQSSPGTISWVYDLRVITLEVEPDPNDATLEQREARWRDPALAQLGFGPGLGGVRDYIEHLRNDRNTDWAYCGFVTKYPLGWFAYASIGGPRLVMDYANDGWGPDNIDRVFAHETGHIFGAPDEYADSGCNCGGQWGFCSRPNGNCANCAAGGGVPCIMKSNSFEMCGYTPYHLGLNVPSTVPFVRELRREQAAHLVRNVCLQPKFGGSPLPGAWVWSQNPAGGTKLARGGTVTMLLRTGPIP